MNVYFWQVLCPKCKRVHNVERWYGAEYIKKKNPHTGKMEEMPTGRKILLPLWTPETQPEVPAQVLPQCLCGQYLLRENVLNKMSGKIEPAARKVA